MLGKNKFVFKALLEDDCSSTGYYLEHGIGLADNYAEAAKLIEDNYRESLIEIKELYLSSNSGTVLQIPEDIYKAYKLEDEYAFVSECDEKGVVNLE